MPREIDNTLESLHPVFRKKAEELLGRLSAEKIPFRLFEGFRTPQRQQYLYEQGRGRPGGIVTKARPWSSNHQYGVAADFVLFENRKWSWDAAGQKAQWWNRLHAIAAELGLKRLSWELPHLELAETSLAALRAGQYPAGGDDSWAENLKSVISAWSGSPPAPPAPSTVPDRPPLRDVRVTEVLRRGASGAEVVELQTKLKGEGFDPGKRDGTFGPATEAAVVAFQRSKGLLADGIAGAKTLEALELTSQDDGPPQVVLLQVGATGPLVVELQKKLKAQGFDPGEPDGLFGPKTEAAVAAFQEKQGVPADGAFGPQLHSALQFEPKPEAPSSNPLGERTMPQVTVDVVTRMFPDTPVGNIKKHLPHVLGALKEEKLVDKNMVLMALATIRAETAGFEPINEFRSRFNTSPDGHPFDLYDHRKDLGNQGPPDGRKFKGRGFIQLTGRHNYEKYGKAIGLGNQLIENPEQANEPGIAARLLARFLKDREMEIKEALLDGSLKTARRLVNGGRHGLEAFTEAFRIGESLLA